MVGKKFNKLTVIVDTKRRNARGEIIYLCKCDCGNTKEIVASKLKNNHTKSCGCLRGNEIDLTNKRFGRLVALKKSHSINNQYYWLCKCDCGNEIEVQSKSLRTGATSSCGCLNTEVRKNTVKDRMQFKDGTSLVQLSPDRKINKNNKLGVRGVSYDHKRQKYVAQITFKRKKINLGRFDEIEDAIVARKDAEAKYFKSYKKEGDKHEI